MYYDQNNRNKNNLCGGGSDFGAGFHIRRGQTHHGPGLFQKSIAALEEKQETVLELTAPPQRHRRRSRCCPATRLRRSRTSWRISAAIFIVLCAIFLEKYLLTITAAAAFKVLIPLLRALPLRRCSPSAADGGRAGVETGIVRRSDHAGNPWGSGSVT